MVESFCDVSRRAYKHSSRTLIVEKVSQWFDNRKNPFHLKQVSIAKGDLLDCPLANDKVPQRMEIDLPQPEPMEINEQLATDFSKKLMIQ